MTTQFKAGKIYSYRFVSNPDAKVSVKIQKRTAKFLSLEYFGDLIHLNADAPKRCKIQVKDGIEWIYPMGKYSMAPRLKASDISN